MDGTDASEENIIQMKSMGIFLLFTYVLYSSML